MKKTTLRILAALLAVIMTLGAAPLETLTGIDFESLFEVKASAGDYNYLSNVCEGEWVYFKTNSSHHISNAYISLGANGIAFFKFLKANFQVSPYSGGILPIDDNNRVSVIVQKLNKDTSKFGNYDYDYFEHAVPLANGYLHLSSNFWGTKHYDHFRLKGKDQYYRIRVSSFPSRLKNTKMTMEIEEGEILGKSLPALTYETKDFFGNTTIHTMLFDTRLDSNYAAENNKNALTNVNVPVQSATSPSFYFKDISSTKVNSASSASNGVRRAASSSSAGASGNSSTDTQVSGKIVNSNGVKVTEYGIYLNTKDSFTGKQSVWSKKGGTTSKNISVSQVLKNLEPDTKYYYALYAKTAYGVYRSDTKSFKTPKVRPQNTTLKAAQTIDYRNGAVLNSNELGSGDSVKVSWNPAKYAEWYTVKVNGKEDPTKIYGTEKAIRLTHDGDADTKVYEISVQAHNKLSDGKIGSSDWTPAKTAIVHRDITLSFKVGDAESGYTDYETHQITWNHDYNAVPVVPSRIGKVFKGWYEEGASAYASMKYLKEDLTLFAQYDPNIYSVTFLDPKGNAIPVVLPGQSNPATTQKVEYGKSAVAPSEEAIQAALDAAGIDTSVYKFVGWDYDFSRVITSLNVRATLDNLNTDRPVEITQVTAERAAGSLGSYYKITCTVKNLGTADARGRILVALKTDAGQMITTTESDAFYIQGNDQVTNPDQLNTKNLEIYVPVDDFMTEKGLVADLAEVYAIADFKSTVPISQMMSTKIEIDNNWSDWYETMPPRYKNAERSEPETQYQSRDIQKTTVNTLTEKNALEADGWTNYETTGPVVNTGSWSRTKPAALEYRTIEEKTVDDTTKKTQYQYKRYKYYNNGWWVSYGSGWATRNGYSGSWEYKTVDSPLPKYKNASDYEGNQAYGTANDHWWYQTKVETTVKTGSHKEYRAIDRIYTYYMNRWPDQFNAWQFDEINELQDDKGNTTREVNTRTVYQYRFNLETPGEIEYDLSNQREDFCVGTLGQEYAGKQVTLFIYKVTEASDWTTEYLAQTVVDEDGNYFFDPYILREEPTPETGDFTVALGVEGADSAVYLGKIEVPDALYNYTVTYQDAWSGVNAAVIDTQTVHRGADAVPPTPPVHEGYTFHHWDMRSTDIRSDTVINAIYQQNSYTVAYVDMQNAEDAVVLQTLTHGSAFDPPMVTAPEELEFVGWQLDNGRIFKPVPVDDEAEAGGMVCYLLDPDGNLTETEALCTTGGVINAVYQPRTFTVVFGGIPNGEEAQQTEQVAGSSGELIAEGYIQETIEDVPFGDTVEEPEDVEIIDDVLFYGWSLDGEMLVDVDAIPIKADSVFTPVYTFVNTTAAPTVSLATGSYESAQTATLNCETENAIIYYTLDGSDPANGENAMACLPGDSVQITESCQLRAVAMCFNMNSSEETDAWFAINDGQHPDQAVLRFAGYDEETVFDTMLVPVNAPIDAGLLPEAEGWTFEGLYRTAELTLDEEEELADVSFSDPWDLATDLITGDTILYLNYTINSYTVTFVDEDGFILDEQTVEYMSEATPPEKPSMDGYVFTGWDTEDYLTVTGDLEVHAVYVPEDEYVIVKLNHSRYYTMTGSSFALEATTEGNDEGVTLTWSSSDASVATVDEAGRVTATGHGEAEITVTVDQNGESATCVLTVMGNPAQELTLKDSSKLTVMQYQTPTDPENEEGSGESVPLLLGFTVETEGDDHHAPTVAQIKAEFKSDGLVFTAADGTPLADTDYIGTGTMIQLTENGEVLDELTAIVVGDLDGDGHVTNRDAAQILRFYKPYEDTVPVSAESLDYIQLIAMDVNADGGVNTRDVSMLLRYLVGKEKIA